MMKKTTLLSMLTLICLSCSQTEGKPVLTKNDEFEDKTFYIETENFGEELNSCFKNTIFNKWSDLDFKLRDTTEEFITKEITEKHIFLDINNFKEDSGNSNFEKITIRLKGDRTIENTKFSIERFKYNGDGTWRRIGNLGDFKTVDRDNDLINPKKLDTDELCQQLIEKTIIASYK